MAIPKEYQNRSVYHFTHVDNLPGILEHGLLSTNEKKRLGIKHTAIAFTDIQARRSCMAVSCGSGGVVHDYVPLYFCKRSSMLLAVINGKIADQQLIIYFEFPISIMNQYPWVLTDASANTSNPPNFYDDEMNLCKLKWKCIDSPKWSMPTDLQKQAHQAELLIHKNIGIDTVSKIIVWNKWVKENVIRAFEKAGHTPPHIAFDENDEHFYTDFYASGENSIVTGPYFIGEEYRKVVVNLLKSINVASSAQFDGLSDMLENGLRKNFGCIPETAELIGLKTNNRIHTVDVGTHTLNVVAELLKTKEYSDLCDADKRLVEIAAYFHDIGKGPKTRWVKSSGFQELDPDHPIKALPMLQRILSQEVRRIIPRSVKVICKLVCYHDIVGDIIGKGRRIDELIDVVNDERELNMLIALGKADMRAIFPAWANQDKIRDIHTKVINALKLEAREK